MATLASLWTEARMASYQKPSSKSKAQAKYTLSYEYVLILAGRLRIGDVLVTVMQHEDMNC